MTLGQRIHELRTAAGLSQEQLAERLNVSRQAVSRWERDETMPETEKVVALADIFGVTTDYLLRNQPSPAPEKKPARDWMERLGYLVRTKGYLLGWVLVAWGVLDLVRLMVIVLMYGGFLKLTVW